MELNDTVKQYVALKEQMKFLSERESVLKKQLIEAVEKSGEVTSKGHIVLEVDGVTLTHQRKASNPLDAKLAEALITEKGLLDTCMPFVRKLNQEAIMAAFYKKEFTEQEIMDMLPEKVTYAFLVT
jgi:hypothetical protein